MQTEGAAADDESPTAVDDDRTAPLALDGGVALTGAVLVAAAVPVAPVEAPNDGVLFFVPYVVAAVGLFVLSGGVVAVASRLR